MKASTVYSIDFGLSKRYRDYKTLQHIKFQQNKNLTGTARYASINAHLGYEQSRRDDLEGLAYVLIYFLKGALPWMGINGADKNEKYSKISQMKMSIKPQRLCAGMPVEIESYLCYCKSLKFDQSPDYELIKKSFRDLFNECNYELNGMLDWNIIEVK